MGGGLGLIGVCDRVGVVIASRAPEALNCPGVMSAERIVGLVEGVAEIAPEMVHDLRPGRRGVDDDGVGPLSIQKAERLARDMVRLAQPVVAADRGIALVSDGVAYLKPQGS